MFAFKVTPDDESIEPFEVTAGARDVAMWEKVTPGASLGKLQTELKMTDMYRVAYFASKRQGLWTGTEKEFAKDTDLSFETEEVDPTQ